MKKGISIEQLAQSVHSAVLRIQADELAALLSLIDTEEEKEQLRHNLEMKNTYDFMSLYSIALSDYGQWAEPLKIQKRRSDNCRMIELFGRHLDVMIRSEIPSSLMDYAFKAEEDESDDEVLQIPKAELLEKGYREIDLDLYIASMRLEYEKVEDLLLKGADPDICFNNYSTASQTAHTEVECALEEIVYPILTGEITDVSSIDSHIGYLVGYAAYDKLLCAFKKYENDNSSKQES